MPLTRLSEYDHRWYSPRGGGNWPFEGELADFIHNNVTQTNVKLSCKAAISPLLLSVFTSEALLQRVLF